MMTAVLSVGVGRAVHLWNDASSRALRAEPLEGRWLLSAAVAGRDAVPSVPAAGPDIRIIALQKLAPGEDDGDAIEVSPSQLPPGVLDGFEDAFDDAKIIKTTVSNDEDGIEYDVTATFKRLTIDVTLNPSGKVLEHEVAMPTADVPQAVIDELLARVGDPHATVDSAAKVFRDGQQLYEVVATDHSGVEWEGDLLFNAPAPAKAPIADAAATAHVVRSAASPSAASQPQLALDAQHDPVGGEGQVTKPATTGENPPRNDTPVADAAIAALARTTAVLATVSADHVAQALDALTAGRGAAVWVPQVAGKLVDVMPIDIEGIEQRMRDVLDRIATPARRSTPDARIKTGIPRIALAVMLIAAVKLLLNQSRRTQGVTAQTLLFGPNASTWSWILGAPTRSRRRSRRVTARPGKS